MSQLLQIRSSRISSPRASGAGAVAAFRLARFAAQRRLSKVSRLTVSSSVEKVSAPQANSTSSGFRLPIAGGK